MQKRVAASCTGEDGKASRPEGPHVREMMTLIGDTWSILILDVLSKMPSRRGRFSEVLKSIPPISERMLSLALKRLEADGFVSREVFPEVPPRVEYELTGLGHSLLEMMQTIVRWVQENWPAVQRARNTYSQKSGEQGAISQAGDPQSPG